MEEQEDTLEPIEQLCEIIESVYSPLGGEGENFITTLTIQQMILGFSGQNFNVVDIHTAMKSLNFKIVKTKKSLYWSVFDRK